MCIFCYLLMRINNKPSRDSTDVVGILLDIPKVCQNHWREGCLVRKMASCKRTNKTFFFLLI